MKKLELQIFEKGKKPITDSRNKISYYLIRRKLEFGIWTETVNGRIYSFNKNEYRKLKIDAKKKVKIAVKTYEIRILKVNIKLGQVLVD